MTNLVYEIIVHHVDSMAGWQEEMAGYSLSHLEDICYNHLDMEETEEERVRLSKNVAVEIFGMIQPNPDPDYDYEEDE